MHASKQLILSAVCFMGLILAPLSARADFYEKDFAKAPGGTTHIDGELNSRPSPTGAVRSNNGVSSESIVPRSRLDALKGEQIGEIGLLVNESTAEEALSQLDVAVKAYPSVKLGPIAISGKQPNAQLAARLNQFRLRGAQLVSRSSSIFSSAKSSPTWAVGTLNGYVLLDGAENPLDFVNSRGEFVSPELARATPTPSVEAEKF